MSNPNTPEADAGRDEKHTPLPWRVFDGGGTIGNGGVLAICSDEKRKNEIVGWPGFDSSNYPEQARANAELIVKAVNSHATLTQDRDALREALENFKVPCGDFRYSARVSRVLGMAWNALFSEGHKTLAREVEALQHHLDKALTETSRCPHPAKGDPDNTTVRECIERGHCGCDNAKALTGART